MSLARPSAAAGAPAPSLAALFDSPLRPTLGGSPALYLPALSAQGPRVFVLFICGNPGVADYYETYLRTLQSSPLLQGRISSLCVSHLGHVSPSRSTRLADQIAQQVTLLDAIRASYPRSSSGGEKEDVKVVLLGHSVGAWIALEVLKQRAESVDAVHLLFPTVAWIGKTPNAGKLRPLFTSISYPLLYPLLALLQLLPLFLLHFLLRVLLRQPDEGARATARFLCAPGGVRNALSMGREEMATIRKVREETREAVRELGGRGFVRAYWGRGEEDQWTPSWIRAQVEAELGLQPLAPIKPSLLAHQAPAGARRLPSFLSLRQRPSAPSNVTSGSNSGGSGHSKAASSPTPSRIPVASASPRRLSARRAAPLLAPPVVPPTQNGIEAEAEGEVEDDGSLTEVAPSSSSSSDDEQQRGDVVARRLFKNANPTSAAAAAGGREWPRLSSTVCEVGTPHAFCLKHGREMAEVAARWLARDFAIEE